MKARWLFAGVLIAALGVAACGDDVGDDDDRGAPRGSTGADTAAPGAPSSGSTGDTTGAGDQALPAIDPSRKIIFTANLALNAEDVRRSFSDALALAQTNGGYVEKSQFENDTETNERRQASMTIRVPVQNYDRLMTSLRGLTGSTVDTEGSNSDEVTEQYTDLESRQRNLERTETQYLELLAQAKTIPDILTVQDRLSGVRSQIEQIQGRLKVLDNQADFATVNLTLSPIVAVKADAKDANWTLKGVLVESWESSLETARYVAAAGMVALVAAAWLVVPVGLGLLGMRRFRKRPAPAAPLSGAG